MDGPSRRPTDSSRSEGTPSLSEVPSGGAKTFWLLLGRLPKVTRCKSGTLSRRYLNNGYVLHPPEQTTPPRRLSSKRHSNFMEMTPALHSLTWHKQVDRPQPWPALGDSP